MVHDQRFNPEAYHACLWGGANVKKLSVKKNEKKVLGA
jgi:hypothetical protein